MSQSSIEGYGTTGTIQHEIDHPALAHTGADVLTPLIVGIVLVAGGVLGKLSFHRKDRRDGAA